MFWRGQQQVKRLTSVSDCHISLNENMLLLLKFCSCYNNIKLMLFHGSLVLVTQCRLHVDDSRQKDYQDILSVR